MHEVPVLFLNFQQTLEPPGHTSTIDQNVDAAQLLDNAGDYSGNLLDIRQIDLQRERIPAGLPALLGYSIDSCFITVEDCYSRPSLQQGENGGAANAGSTPGHKR